MRYVICFTISMMIFLPISSQGQVEEKVSVDWWVLPIFVLDKDSKSVFDLKETDIDLRVNNQKITDFILYKRSFNVEEEVEKETAQAPVVDKNKIVFLLFDTAFSTQDNFNRSKEIAKDLVFKSEDNTLFSVVAIDPFAGPVYAGGPHSDKAKVEKLIDEKIKWVPNAKSVGTVLYLATSTQVSGGAPGGRTGVKARLDRRDLANLREQRSGGLRKSNVNYFRAFQTLYHALNSITDNKFIYLFSEGLSLFARQAVVHGGEEYWFFIKQTASYLGRCGAVLFIVNPAGAGLEPTNIVSGEDSLRFLARESGGKYMEGEEKTIKKQIESMARAYYEIAFPDREAFTDGIRKISVRPQRRGVRLHTLRNLEKFKPYGDMNQVEKELLIVNLLNPSPLFHSPLKTSHLEIDKSLSKEGHFIYKIDLPKDFEQQELDFYKIRTAADTHAVTVKEEKIVTTEKDLQIDVDKADAAELRFVLVDQRANKALVQGIFDAKAEQESIMSDRAMDFKKKIASMKQEDLSKLNSVALGAMEYSTRLANEAFHFICKETVSEVVDDIRVHKRVRESEYDRDTSLYRAGFDAQNDRRVVRRKNTNKYVNDYQLVSSRGQVSEKRKLIKGKIKKVAGKEGLLKLDAFVSKKIALIPLALLGPGSGDRFHFRFIENDKLKGVKTAVIECFPKNPGKTKSIYGKIWVDLEDNSVMRISVNPISIGGYENLLKRARYYNSKLILTCDIDFFKKHGGIRFPTKVFIRETYSGGRELRNVVRRSVWERSKTTYTYDDYKFFDVEATSNIENRD